MKAQSSQWKLPGAPHLKKVQQSCSKIKTMLTVFFDWEGVTHHEYTLQAKQLIRSNYLHVLHWLRDAIRENGHRYGQLVTGSFITSCAEILVKHQITQVMQPPYSPDLSPCDFWLFPKLKSPLKGKRFHIVDGIQENKWGS